MQGNRDNHSQALYQLAGMAIVLTTAIVGGLLTGNIFLFCFKIKLKDFQDKENEKGNVLINVSFETRFHTHLIWVITTLFLKNLYWNDDKVQSKTIIFRWFFDDDLTITVVVLFWGLSEGGCLGIMQIQRDTRAIWLIGKSMHFFRIDFARQNAESSRRSSASRGDKLLRTEWIQFP